MDGNRQRGTWRRFRSNRPMRVLARLTVPVLLLALTGCGTIDQTASLPAVSPTSPRVATPSATPTDSQITVTPSTQLTGGETVHVAVHDFAANSKVFLSECAAAADVNAMGCGPQLGAQAFLFTDASGTASGTFTVSPVAASRPNVPPSAKCLDRCVLVATSGLVVGSPPHVAAAPLAFGVPLPPASPVATPAIPADAPFDVQRRITLPVPGPAERLVAGGGQLFALACNPSCTVIRLDPGAGRVEATAPVDGAADLAFADGRLWVTRGTPGGDGQPSVPPALVALDPTTLAVRLSIPLPERPTGLAVAGGQLWVAGRDALRAVDPRSSVIAHTVPVDAGNVTPGFPVIAASADGTALWTTIFDGGGGRFPIQLRSPADGHVVAETEGPGAVGPTSVAAASDHVWIGYSTGMLGGYLRVNVTAGALTVQRVTGPGGPRMLFTNGVSAHLVDGRLWIVDGMSGSVACARDATGQVLARARLDGPLSDAVAALDGGRLALAEGDQILIVTPAGACTP